MFVQVLYDEEILMQLRWNKAKPDQSWLYFLVTASTISFRTNVLLFRYCNGAAERTFHYITSSKQTYACLRNYYIFRLQILVNGYLVMQIGKKFDCADIIYFSRVLYYQRKFPPSKKCANLLSWNQYILPEIKIL